MKKVVGVLTLMMTLFLGGCTSSVSGTFVSATVVPSTEEIVILDKFEQDSVDTKTRKGTVTDYYFTFEDSGRTWDLKLYLGENTYNKYEVNDIYRPNKGERLVVIDYIDSNGDEQYYVVSQMNYDAFADKTIQEGDEITFQNGKISKK